MILFGNPVKAIHKLIEFQFSAFFMNVVDHCNEFVEIRRTMAMRVTVYEDSGSDTDLISMQMIQTLIRVGFKSYRMKSWRVCSHWRKW